jgi:hypothetical protein
VLVDAESAALADLQSGRLGQRRVRPHADRENHEVGRVHLPRSRLYFDRTTLQLGEARRRVVEDDIDAVLLHVFLDEAGDFMVQWAQELRQFLEEGHFKTQVNQILRRLEADEPAADNDGPHRRLHVLDPRVCGHPRQELGASCDPLANRAHVRHGPHMEDPGQVDAGQRRMNRDRPGREDELVVRFRRHLAGGDVFQVDGLLLRVDGDRLAVRPHVDSIEAAEHLLVGDQKARLLRDHSSDVVRQPAIGVTNVRPPLHHEDLGFLIQPP